MAVFLAASDESSGANAFGMYHYAGWIAPLPDWSLYFTPAWQERVLDGPPKIPYLHMTEMRSKAWRQQWGITETNMDERLDEAARVINEMGCLYPLKVTIDASIFRQLYKPHKMVAESGGKKDMEPDFLAFCSYVLAVLSQVQFKHPEVEKVDFLVENNSEITKHIYELYKSLPASLNGIGKSELVPLVGEFIPGGKERVPLQAADYLCWHSQRAEAQMLSDIRDLRRWNTIAHRKGFNLPLPTSVLTALAQKFTEYGKENEMTNKVRSLRQNYARSDEHVAGNNQSKAGRRKGGKAKEKKTEV
jgi:hypothetical protein